MDRREGRVGYLLSSGNDLDPANLLRSIPATRANIYVPAIILDTYLNHEEPLFVMASPVLALTPTT